MILPALSVGYRYSAVSMRMTRSTVLEVLREDYVRTARAKGVQESIVVMRHALRNALLPVITVVSLEFAFPHRRARRDGAGLQPERIGKAARDAVTHALHAHPSPRAGFSQRLSCSSLRRRHWSTSSSIRGSGTRDGAGALGGARFRRCRKAPLPRVDRTAAGRAVLGRVHPAAPAWDRGAVLIVVMLLTAALADRIAPYDPTAFNFADLLQGPSFSICSGPTVRDATSSRGSSTARGRGLLVGFTASFVGCTAG